MATPGRVQAPEFQRQPQLAPAPVVNVQAVAPVNQAGAGSNLLRIADSLASLNPIVARFAQTQRVTQEKQQKESAASMSLYTYDQIAEARKKDPKLDNDATDAVAGKALGIDFQNTVLQEIISDPNWDGNADSIRQRAIEYAKEKGLSDIGMASYSQYLDGMIQGIQNNRNAEVAKSKLQEQVTNAEIVAAQHGQEILKSELEKAGNDPEKMKVAYANAAKAQLSELRAALPAWATNEDKQNSDLRAVEAAVASGDMQLLEALLNDDRNGVGPLSKITALQPNIDVWRKKADANFREKNKTSGLEFESEGLRLILDPNTTFEQFDTWKKRASTYLSPDEIGSMNNRFIAAQAENSNRRAAAAQSTADKAAVIGKTTTYLLTGAGDGGTLLKDGAEVTSDKDVNSRTTISSTEVKKETVNALKGKAQELFPDNIKQQTLFLVPALKRGNLDMPEHNDAISLLVTANPTEKLKTGITKEDEQSLELITTLIETGDIPYLKKIIPESGSLFMGVLQSKIEAGIKPKQALLDTYAIMTKPERASDARQAVTQVRQGWDDDKSITELMDDSTNGGSLLSDKLFQLSMAGANIYDPKVREKAAEDLKKNHVKIGQAFIPKNIVGWGENTGEDIKAYVETVVPQIGPKMVPPVDSVDGLSIRETADGFNLVDTNTGLPLMKKTVKGGVSSSELLVIRKDDVDEFRKLRKDRAAIPAEANANKLAKEVGAEPTIVLEEVPTGRGGVAMRPKKLSPAEVVDKKAADEKKQIEKNLKDAERRNPNTLEDRKKKLRQLDDDGLRSYLEKAKEPGKYLPEEIRLIEEEAKRRGIK